MYNVTQNFIICLLSSLDKSVLFIHQIYTQTVGCSVFIFILTYSYLPGFSSLKLAHKIDEIIS